MALNHDLSNQFPLKQSPLVQCITNEITCESMANALLYVGAKPIMADDSREFKQLFTQTDALLLNLGHLSEKRQISLLEASRYAKETKKPTVVDLVGYGVSDIRNQVSLALVENHPTVVKGNTSELRNFCELTSHGRGVDGNELDQGEESLNELIDALKEMSQYYPYTTFLATGPKDIVVSHDRTVMLSNGVEELDRFTGTGDIVGALIAALLGDGQDPFDAVIGAVSYFNLCGEKAKSQSNGLADFRFQTLNHLSLLMEENWNQSVKGWEK
ncbi:hydroxyethylthiazole kinase [Marinilactibacillus sp. XAAS-LB27]|uniref:hydroxyethylthiazole kinase n=1 Tax=Marinilactibacillus sp. XAAS-LB27 TaxID=3114538 RepID=UPI002E192509|nr:hydroxyethylthiazole kinase [Marinilactibacillus sp. XAAS-LB27]